MDGEVRRSDDRRRGRRVRGVGHHRPGEHLVLQLRALHVRTGILVQLRLRQRAGHRACDRGGGAGSGIEAFVADALAELTAEELGPAGFVLLFPIRNAARPYALRLPEEEQVVLFDICTSGSPEDPGYVPTQLHKARVMYERAHALGGTLYPIGSTPLTTEDWRTHYGSDYQALRTAKEHYDPANVLGPGAGIF